MARRAGSSGLTRDVVADGAGRVSYCATPSTFVKCLPNGRRTACPSGHISPEPRAGHDTFHANSTPATARLVDWFLAEVAA